MVGGSFVRGKTVVAVRLKIYGLCTHHRYNESQNGTRSFTKMDPSNFPRDLAHV